MIDGAVLPFRRAQQALEIVRRPLDFLHYMAAVRRASRRGTMAFNSFNCGKYLGVYLAAGLTPAQRRDAILFHHAWLARMSPDRRWPADFCLWIGPEKEVDMAIRVRAARRAPMEGEHELAFHYAGEIIFTLTFLFARGDMLGGAAAPVMAIGGVQGAYNAREKVRAAAKANGEVSPPAMLLIAAKALAEALGVTTLVGVGSRQQAATDYAADAIALSYDRLWLELGGARDQNGWFRVHPGVAAKPLEEVGRSHRARTRRKRELKASLHREIVAVAQTGLRSA